MKKLGTSFEQEDFRITILLHFLLSVVGGIQRIISNSYFKRQAPSYSINDCLSCKSLYQFWVVVLCRSIMQTVDSLLNPMISDGYNFVNTLTGFIPTFYTTFLRRRVSINISNNMSSSWFVTVTKKIFSVWMKSTVYMLVEALYPRWCLWFSLWFCSCLWNDD